VKIIYGAHPSGSRWEDSAEIPDEEWDEMSPEEQMELLDVYAQEALAYSCESWAYPELEHVQGGQ
jgi:hypothetical protein